MGSCTSQQKVVEQTNIQKGTVTRDRCSPNGREHDLPGDAGRRGLSETGQEPWLTAPDWEPPDTEYPDDHRIVLGEHAPSPDTSRLGEFPVLHSQERGQDLHSGRNGKQRIVLGGGLPSLPGPKIRLGSPQSLSELSTHRNELQGPIVIKESRVIGQAITLSTDLDELSVDSEKEHFEPKHAVNAADFSSFSVSYPPMRLCEKRVYHLMHVTKDGRKMFNASGSWHGGKFKWYPGTCSSTCIPVPHQGQHPTQDPNLAMQEPGHSNTSVSEEPSVANGPMYWETHSFLKVNDPVQGWNPLIEMGVYQAGELNKQYARGIADHKGKSWAVRVTPCWRHDRICTQVWGEGQQAEECEVDTLKNVVNNEVNFRFGIVLDVQRGRLAFMDLELHVVLCKFDVSFTESLVPMFAMATGPHYYSIGTCLVSAADIELTEDKMHLIAEALS